MDHQRRADLMLLLATSFWGISNCLTAICLRDMQPLTLNAFRFITAFLVLGFVFRKNLRRVSRVTVKYSILVGLSLVIVYTSLTYGVMYTSVSNAGFIGALSVVTTPILEFIVYHKKPEKKFGVSMILCLIGLALMTLNETLKPAFGDIICLFAAVFYSVDLMVTEKAVANVLDGQVHGAASTRANRPSSAPCGGAATICAPSGRPPVASTRPRSSRAPKVS